MSILRKKSKKKKSQLSKGDILANLVGVLILLVISFIDYLLQSAYDSPVLLPKWVNFINSWAFLLMMASIVTYTIRRLVRVDYSGESGTTYLKTLTKKSFFFIWFIAAGFILLIQVIIKTSVLLLFAFSNKTLTYEPIVIQNFYCTWNVTDYPGETAIGFEDSSYHDYQITLPQDLCKDNPLKVQQVKKNTVALLFEKKNLFGRLVEGFYFGENHLLDQHLGFRLDNKTGQAIVTVTDNADVIHDVMPLASPNELMHVSGYQENNLYVAWNQKSPIDFDSVVVNLNTGKQTAIIKNLISINPITQFGLTYEGDQTFAVSPLFTGCSNPATMQLKDMDDTYGINRRTAFLQGGSIFIDYYNQAGQEKQTELTVNYSGILQDCQ